MPLGTLRLPTTDELRKVAGELGMTMSDDELVQHRACLEGGIAAYNIVDRPVHVNDLNATILHCLGIDHRRFTVPFNRRAM